MSVSANAASSRVSTRGCCAMSASPPLRPSANSTSRSGGTDPGYSAPGIVRHGRVRPLPNPIACIARQIEFGRRPLAGAAFDRAMPARAGDEAVNLRQAKPGTNPRFLGGEKRVEGFLLHVRRHTAAGIADEDADIVAGR